ncbi:MAG: 4-(cytidine 5'-diphospho)-2-C-methyl-D-erythritol kinase, partial [Pseudomonadota bacterium]
EETARTLGRAPGGGARGADIRLTKNLPIASGVGGGSADAAAVLWALNTLWDLRLPSGELEALGFTLGADLPMCVRGAPARALGAGERLSPAPAPPPVSILLVNPLVETPTGPIFRAFDAALEAGEAASSPALEGWPASFDGVHAFAEFLRRGRNDLQAPAIALQPVVGDVLAALERSGAVLARMSGSGATCFGLFGAADAALAAQDAIQSAEPGWWTQVARLDAASAIAPHIRQHSEEGP